jgi:hypothetical protein
VREAVVSSGSRAHPRPAITGATGLLIGSGALLVTLVTMGASAIPSTSGGLRFGVVAFAVGAFAALTLDRMAVAGTGALAWLLVNGFLVDRFGELSWHGRADVYRALMLVAVASVGLIGGHAVRLRSVWHRHRRFNDEWRAVASEFDEFSQFDEKETRDA